VNAVTAAASGVADRVSRLIWTVLLDAGRSDLADVVADRLAGTPGADLRIRAAGALRAVLGGVMPERDAVELLRRGITRDELALLTEGDRRLVESASTTRDLDAAGRRRAARVVADLLDRVADVLGAARAGAAGTTSGLEREPAATTVV
jgi:hypothetical protein